MSGMEDHLRIVLREARATTAAAAHYHVYQVAHRFLVAPAAFPTRPNGHPGAKRTRERNTRP